MGDLLRKRVGGQAGGGRLLRRYALQQVRKVLSNPAAQIFQVRSRSGTVGWPAGNRAPEKIIHLSEEPVEGGILEARGG